MAPEYRCVHCKNEWHETNLCPVYKCQKLEFKKAQFQRADRMYSSALKGDLPSDDVLSLLEEVPSINLLAPVVFSYCSAKIAGYFVLHVCFRPEPVLSAYLPLSCYTEPFFLSSTSFTVFSSILRAACWTMAPLCFACANDLAPDHESMRCAICEASFHDACTRIPQDLLASVKLYSDLHWSPGCTKALENPRSKALKDVGLKAGFHSALGALVESLKEAIIPPLTSELHALAKASASHSTFTGPTVTAGCTYHFSPTPQLHRPSSYATIASHSNAPSNVTIARALHRPT
ncbi:putative nucleic acid binding protein [Anopheles sinensis]|uniref:Putative nucleic acid binding protein n=1 Tax=Anopheles sinensis TaxID=74873 RepID=A0A084VDX0_ANOSI|nr:putative nucleic acid binding protein [Anopheles sinensis]